jgi:hypothetical protein
MWRGVKTLSQRILKGIGRSGASFDRLGQDGEFSRNRGNEPGCSPLADFLRSTKKPWALQLLTWQLEF